jgi:hypothetical protein
MRRLGLLVLVAVIGVVGAVLAQPASATTGFKDVEPLLNCSDVNGSGQVTIADVMQVLGSYYQDWPTRDYMYLNDTTGDGLLRIDDITTVLDQYFDTCPLIDSQVAAMTMASAPYKDCQDALADGYIATTQFVPNMGIHLQKAENFFDGEGNRRPFYSGSLSDPNDQIRNPVGLICTDKDNTPGQVVPDRLIGMWYAEPSPAVCPYYGIDPGTCSYLEPIGFGLTDTDEDNIDVSPPVGGNPPLFGQKAWHTHIGLCIGGLGTPSVYVTETFDKTTEDECLAGFYGACGPSPCVWFHTYSWMGHLYNFIPNAGGFGFAGGRFQMWSDLVPAPVGGAGAAAGDLPLTCFTGL